MRPCNCGTNRQPKATAARCSGTGHINAVKWLKDMANMLRVDARRGILDPNQDAVELTLNAEFYPPGCIGLAQTVSNHIGQQLIDPAHIPPHTYFLRTLGLEVEHYAVAQALRRKPLDDLLAQ